MRNYTASDMEFIFRKAASQPIPPDMEELIPKVSSVVQTTKFVDITLFILISIILFFTLCTSKIEHDVYVTPTVVSNADYNQDKFINISTASQVPLTTSQKITANIKYQNSNTCRVKSLSLYNTEKFDFNNMKECSPSATSIGSSNHRLICFDGRDSGKGLYARIPHNDELNLNGGSYTIEAWVKPSSILPFSKWGQWIINKGNSEKELEYILGLYSSGFVVFNSNYTGPLFTNKRLIVGEWYHIAVTVNNNNNLLTTTIYINGDIEASMKYPIGVVMKTNSPLFIGARNYFGQDKGVENWCGEISEIRLWNIALSKEHIQFNSEKMLTGDEVGLIGNWHFTTPRNNILTDKSTKRFNGTLYNSIPVFNQDENQTH